LGVEQLIEILQLAGVSALENKLPCMSPTRLGWADKRQAPQMQFLASGEERARSL